MRHACCTLHHTHFLKVKICNRHKTCMLCHSTTLNSLKSSMWHACSTYPSHSLPCLACDLHVLPLHHTHFIEVQHVSCMFYLSITLTSLKSGMYHACSTSQVWHACSTSPSHKHSLPWSLACDMHVVPHSLHFLEVWHVTCMLYHSTTLTRHRLDTELPVCILLTSTASFSRSLLPPFPLLLLL